MLKKGVEELSTDTHRHVDTLDNSLFEVELQKPRNLSSHESEECDHGEGVGVYTTLRQSDTQ